MSLKSLNCDIKLLVNMSLYECEKYICTVDSLRETIDKYGVAIVPNVLEESEVQAMITGMWDFLTHITQTWPVPLTQSNPASWKEIHNLHLLRGAMFQQYSCGQSQFMWNLRQNLKIVSILSAYWNVSPEELLVSFDGANFSIPSNHALPDNRRNNRHINEDLVKPWYHLDQSLTRTEFETLQGWVNAYDTNDDDATLGFLEKSNIFFQEFSDFTAAKSISDWKLLTDEELDFYKARDCEEKRIKCPAGSLVLWDSRTVHFGAPSMKTGRDQNFRLVSYICYRPRYCISREELQVKQRAFNELNTTSHHPTHIKTFKKLPPNVKLKYDVTQIEPPVLNELGRLLAGF